jgi:hypothetical protein
MRGRESERARYWLLLPFLGLMAVMPLAVHGCSCGHDFGFHLQSWVDAAAQMRQGVWWPRWDGTAAWHAGEPRFLFYPPVSWMLGAVLTRVVTLPAAPIVLTWIALSGAAMAMYRLAREFAAGNVALLAAAVYLVLPYMMFTAVERTAYAELLAAIWLPLILLAALRERPSIAGIAAPVALVWLTNAPAAVMGTYAFALVIAVRMVLLAVQPQRRVVLRGVGAPSPPTAVWLAARAGAGLVLGLGMAAFYVLPAAYERKYVQIAMAIIPNMRFQDNFLFGHTGDAPHDAVLRTASWIAVSMLSAAMVVLGMVVLVRMRRGVGALRIEASVLALVVVAAVVGLMLTPLSAVVWGHLPELMFLQFPWRMLAVLGVVIALGVALMLVRVRVAYVPAVLVCVVGVSAAAFAEAGWFRQRCEFLDRPAVQAAMFASGHGTGPTDEYTPGDADNDVLRWDDPGYWLTTDAQGFAAGTVANPAATIVNYDAAPPVDETVSASAPRHFVGAAKVAEFLVLNLREYPAWVVRRDGVASAVVSRDDGLVEVAVPAGRSQIDVAWRRAWDEVVGVVVSLVAVGLVVGEESAGWAGEGERVGRLRLSWRLRGPSTACLALRATSLRMTELRWGETQVGVGLLQSAKYECGCAGVVEGRRGDDGRGAGAVAAAAYRGASFDSSGDAAFGVCGWEAVAAGALHGGGAVRGDGAAGGGGGAGVGDRDGAYVFADS